MDVVGRLTRYFRRVSQRLRARARHRLHYSRVVLNSLVYNEFADIYYVGDTCMEPLFWIVDHFTKAMGPIFVATVTIVACTVIAIAYVIGIPYWWENNKCVLLVALVIGHWLLINIVFHYWMALTTNPGTPPENATHLNTRKQDFMRKYYITFTVFICIGIFFALGALTMWHARLITHGETSIEAHINKTERIRLGKEGVVYKNPYDFGPRQNWRIFLGLTNGRTWKHLLLPSAHLPEGNGLTWTTIYSERW
nr:palmitoyltransferase ZDHHC16-like isoform X2 [Rhipicephalus microplus]